MEAWTPPPPAACAWQLPAGRGALGVPLAPTPLTLWGKNRENCFLLPWALLCFGFVGDVWGELGEGVG